MSPVDTPSGDEPHRVAEATWNALFAADVKRLIRASRKNDHDEIAEIRRFYARDTTPSPSSQS
ncbi:hypothetical protein ACFOVU_18410 [Nocardiopsis sediminis]|uniref:Uncharacterized protein n=1 Tax=Nocardiopsis sediminis TaxID=1778267 RepID=A0ABV8FRN0_9ACTN